MQMFRLLLSISLSALTLHLTSADKYEYKPATPSCSHSPKFPVWYPLLLLLLPLNPTVLLPSYPPIVLFLPSFFLPYFPLSLPPTAAAVAAATNTISGTTTSTITTNSSRLLTTDVTTDVTLTTYTTDN